MVMVKASAYGSGAVEVAKQLEFAKVDYLAVAYTDEGVELRKAGIQLPIMVLNPEIATFNDLVDYALEPELSNLLQLQAFSDFVKAQDSDAYIHIKLDTGMHRLGFEAQDIDELIQIIKSNPRIHVKSIMTHLAASEAAEHDSFSKAQIKLFLAHYKRIKSQLGYAPIRHVLNSGGIVRFPEYQMDMVRLGIGLYGIDSSGLIQEQLRVVNTLKATISQIKTIKSGETVSYGRSGKAHKDMRIATLSIGYADGLPRSAGNLAYRVLIRGQQAPIFGTVCMDMCMVDVSHIESVQQGDEVIIFGEAPSVQALAAAVGTIPYEIFTGVADRVKRIYFQE